MKRIVLNLSVIVALLLALFASFQTSVQAGSGMPSFSLLRAINVAANGVTNPIGPAVDKEGNLYIVDSVPDNPRVFKYDSRGRFVLAWGSRGSGPGEFELFPAHPEDGPNGGFIAVDSHGDVYVSDTYNYRVQKFNSRGHFLSQFGEAGSGNGQFDPPALGPLTIDQHDNIWVSTFPRVQKFDSRGRFLASYSGNGDFLGAGQVALDRHGNMYIPDLFNARMQKLDSSGNFLQAWGTPGSEAGQFIMPVLAAFDHKDRLYVADNSNHIQLFTTGGEYIGQLSEPGQGYLPFTYPGAAFDQQGNLYVADISYVYVFRITH